ncbi:MAG: 6-carboxytetrahydropterin synthase [Candidatus Rokubacteria bacterium]|nr:6-carboxytetrahydropterin synthase [Candidatus Rokubacteria bacterium]MBI2198552.1 6-carboxytetrahydropterin synthase [Candidatus Rokubacteria bacterium]
MSALRLTRLYHFSAGHRLASPALSDAENARVYGQCYRQHGHNYRVEVTLAGRPDPTTGMAADLALLDTAVERVILERVDHHDLSGTVPALDGVITTGENLARAFWQWLEPALPPATLTRVAVIETDNNAFEYRGETTR